ncbi:glycosyltransferase [Paracoccus sediminicola]|uniref:glycosyltransferase n=1 Tax=Paracoccus sediminicola TaxID=3017783 RepID=UPI0022F1370D|nr:glycosyltransferase [Paracoccus sediminicola]WBU56493.1 glycosyltransferase [Paracoccus sediminicola]
MKILMMQAGFSAGGAEKVMAALAAHRAAQGDEVHVGAMTMGPEGSFFPYPPEVTLHVVGPRGKGGRFVQPRRALGTARLIRKLRPDLIVSFLTKVNCLTLFAATGSDIPVVISERNNPSAQSARFWRKFQRKLMPRAAGIAMQTRDAAADLPPAQQRRAHIIPNPCLPVDYTPAAPTDHCRFVAVGRLVEQKGFDMLIDAFAALPQDLDATLDIFGQGHRADTLQRQINSRGLEKRVRLAGLAGSAREWLGAGDALVVSSRYEGFCNVLAEATCSGLPAIGFDCPYSIGEMIHDGVNGLLVPDGDVPAMTAAMEKFARDATLRKHLSSSPEIMASRLDPDRIMGLWDQLIDEAARGLSKSPVGSDLREDGIQLIE